MDPYEVLGIPPTATLDDAEAAYHHLLRIHHPDMHHGAGPDAVAAAEKRTRELNAAIGLVREGGFEVLDPDTEVNGTRDFWTGGFTGTGASHVRSETRERPREDTDGWSAWTNDERPFVPTACPWCGTVFVEPESFRSHVEHEHDLDLHPHEPRKRRRRFRRRSSEVPLLMMIVLAVLIAVGAAWAATNWFVYQEGSAWINALGLAIGPTILLALFLDAHRR